MAPDDRGPITAYTVVEQPIAKQGRDVMDIEKEWCSWCYLQTAHSQVNTPSLFGRLGAAIYQCQGCGNYTRRCATCSKMACASPQVSHRLCATYRGEITSFELQSRSIADPCDYKALFKNVGDPTSTDTDIKRAIKKTALKTGTVVGTVLLAATVRKVAGGNVGRLLGYTGKVADNTGLSWIGGGPLSNGGGGIQTGTHRTYYALGKAAVYRVRQIDKSYFGGLQDEFKVRLVRAGRDPAVICINGFHNEEMDENSSRIKDQEWLDGLGAAYADRAIYRIVWPSKTFDITKLQLGKTALLTAGSIALARLSMRANKSNGSLHVAGPLAIGTFAAAAADFSWLTSLSNARRTAYLLAELISRCEDRTFVLIGHSLGARVCVLTLRRLAKRAVRKSRISDVHLLGGAIDKVNAEYWEPIAKLIDGRCTNYHSDHDAVLQWLYPAGTANLLAKPIGRYTIPTTPDTEHKIASVDVSHLVKDHQHYHRNFVHILQNAS